MEDDLRLKNYSPHTRLAYLRCARAFAAHFRRSPEEMGGEEIREFLLHLVKVKKIGPVNLRMHVAAIRFLYRVTLGRPQEIAGIQYPKVPVRIPEPLSPEEIELLISSFRSRKHRTIAILAYGAGLRISEVCQLKTGDIDASRRVIRVRSGKGAKDRDVMLGDRVLDALREYWRVLRPAGPYLFPSQKLPKQPISPGAIRSALRKAARQAGIRKRCTPHVLRHSFASHLLDLGADLRRIQVLLGHRHLDSTARYLFVAGEAVSRVPSPLDLLWKRQS